MRVQRFYLSSRPGVGFLARIANPATINPSGSANRHSSAAK